MYFPHQIYLNSDYQINFELKYYSLLYLNHLLVRLKETNPEYISSQTLSPPCD